MNTNYVLIDYENVQPTTLHVLEQEHFKLLVFVGANQAKIGFDIAVALQRMGTRAEYIKISGNGANALDFHIAYSIGRLAAQDPSASFHIISNDTGFDPLIEYLKTQKIRASRSRAVADIPLVKAATAGSRQEQLAVILSKFQQPGATKPRTVTTLSNAINALFQKRLSEAEVAALIQALAAQGAISIHDTKITFSLAE